MSFYLSWAIVWWFRFFFICSVGQNDSEQMVTQPMIEQKTVQETGKERKRLRWATQNEFQRRSRRKKSTNIFIFCRWFVVCRFIMSSESPCPMYGTYCVCSTHTPHIIIVTIYIMGIPFISSFSWLRLCDRHYGIIACNAIVCIVNGSRDKRHTYIWKKHLLKESRKKCLHWVFNVFTSNKFNERIVYCEKSSLCFIDIFDWIVGFACVLK